MTNQPILLWEPYVGLIVGFQVHLTQIRCISYGVSLHMMCSNTTKQGPQGFKSLCVKNANLVVQEPVIAARFYLHFVYIHMLFTCMCLWLPLSCLLMSSELVCTCQHALNFFYKFDMQERLSFCLLSVECLSLAHTRESFSIMSYPSWATGELFDRGTRSPGYVRLALPAVHTRGMGLM